MKDFQDYEMLDVIGELFSDEISIAVSDGEHYVYYRPSVRVDLKIKAGDMVKPGSLAHKALSSGQKVSDFINRDVFAVPFAIFVTKSTAKGGNISSIVPFVSHVDHTEHDVDIVVTEQGYADLRGLAPRERVLVIIENCAHPTYRAQLLEYYAEALTRGGQTPHVLEKAFSWHTNLKQNGTMLHEVGQLVY